MFFFLKYKFGIIKLFLKQLKTERFYHKIIQNAKKGNKKNDDIDELFGEASTEYSLTQDELNDLITSAIFYEMTD